MADTTCWGCKSPGETVRYRSHGQVQEATACKWHAWVFDGNERQVVVDKVGNNPG